MLSTHFHIRELRGWLVSLNIDGESIQYTKPPPSIPPSLRARPILFSLKLITVSVFYHDVRLFLVTTATFHLVRFSQSCLQFYFYFNLVCGFDLAPLGNRSSSDIARRWTDPMFDSSFLVWGLRVFILTLLWWFKPRQSCCTLKSGLMRVHVSFYAVYFAVATASFFFFFYFFAHLIFVVPSF